jgi:tripartite-type tricarboxylate transporter receptor subunit TctC
VVPALLHAITPQEAWPGGSRRCGKGSRFAGEMTGEAPMRRLLALVAALLLWPAAASVAEWPERPVRVIVPFPAGGAADTAGRLYSDVLGKVFGRPFIVENRTGGNGVIGAEAVARADPDGYTLLVSGMPIQVFGPAINRYAGYDPMRDFTHIAYFGGAPSVLMAHPLLGVTTYQEFLVRARGAAGGTEYVSAGFGTMGNWVAEYLATAERVKLTHIAYKGGSTALLDLLAGHVKIGMLSWPSVAGQIRSGTLVPLAVTSANRLPNAPELPTLRELGHPEFVATTWFSLSGPAGLPRDVVRALNREVIRAMGTPLVKKQIAYDAIETRPMTPAEITQFSQSEIDRWAPLIKRVMASKAQ